MAALYWAFGGDDVPRDALVARGRALGKLRDAFGPGDETRRFVRGLVQRIGTWHETAGFLDEPGAMAGQAGGYLFEALQHDPLVFTFSHPAEALRDKLLRWLEDHGGSMSFEDALRPLGDDWPERFRVKAAYLRSFAERHGDDEGLDPDAAVEAAALMLCDRHLSTHVAGGDGRAEVRGLLGNHPRIEEGQLELRLDRFLARLQQFREERVPGFRGYREARGKLVDQERDRLRVDEYKPKVMSAFVRNKLINDVYLHLVGDNLAKQMGAAGDSKRTDLMGLLLLISPPGYGKTTLMEYVASRLGLTFVKVNGPALGHEVTSIDPAEAPNATARQEVDKVNLALEMGNNVMLYLDDIQHCHPEFLQKFISLCDAQRRIEGVWKGKTRTYDLRGKKFAVVMAGNPYTESGDKFQIPDMLANRADTYNLGDILGGREAVFALSFIENSLTSNPVLQPLAGRSQDDVYKLVRKAQGEPIATTDLSHDYSAVELSEIDAVFQHLFACQEVLLKVNAEYIRSAAMEDAFRVEPRFQLQGSYRNMNKLAEKVVPAMNAEEVQQLITDHYTGEAQTLTTGAEFNLLKLAELRGVLTDDERGRLEKMREEFRRQQLMGGDDDPASKISGVLAGLVQEVGGVTKQLSASSEQSSALSSTLSSEMGGLREALAAAMGGAQAGQQGLTAEVAGLRETLARAEGTQTSLEQVSQAVTGIAAALNDQRSTDVVAELAALREVMATPAPPTAAPIDVGPLLAELRAIRERLEQAPAVATAPAVAAAPAGPTSRRRSLISQPPSSPAVVDPDAETPPRPPRREELQRALLRRAEQALSEEPTPPLPANSSDGLVAALTVIEQLTVQMAAAAQSRLPSDQHSVFLEELRRTVAKAVSDLAGPT